MEFDEKINDETRIKTSGEDFENAKNSESEVNETREEKATDRFSRIRDLFKEIEESYKAQNSVSEVDEAEEKKEIVKDSVSEVDGSGEKKEETRSRESLLKELLKRYDERKKLFYDMCQVGREEKNNKVKNNKVKNNEVKNEGPEKE